MGKLPAPALGGWYFGWYFGTIPFGRNPVLTIWQEHRFWRIWRELLVVGILVGIFGTAPFGSAGTSEYLFLRCSKTISRHIQKIDSIGHKYVLYNTLSHKKLFPAGTKKLTQHHNCIVL